MSAPHHEASSAEPAPSERDLRRMALLHRRALAATLPRRPAAAPFATPLPVAQPVSRPVPAPDAEGTAEAP